MNPPIPFEKWNPLSMDEVAWLFEGAPFAWGVAGGYAIELFLEESIRPHEDTDIILFRDEQLEAQQWLQGWQLYASVPPGRLRPWLEDEFLPTTDTIWAHQPDSDAWQFQFLLTDVDGDEWVSKRSPLIRGKREELFTNYQGIPCIRAEIQLKYKAKRQRPRDEQDFHACLPHLSTEAKQWLKEKLMIIYPEGHDWLQFLP